MAVAGNVARFTKAGTEARALPLRSRMASALSPENEPATMDVMRLLLRILKGR